MALTTYLATVPAHGTLLNTKAAYVELTAATPYASSRLYLMLRFSNTVSKFYLIDLATGAAGAETVVVANLHMHGYTESANGWCLPLDVDIPAGTRVAVRCQSNVAGAGSTMQLAVMFEDRALASLANPVTYGTVLASSRGTQVDPGAVAATKGAYVALSASTTARIDALVLNITVNAGAATITAFTEWQVDIAIGAAGVETVVVPDLFVVANSLADGAQPQAARVVVSIPAGSRLAVRCLCNRNTATERLLCVTAIGMQEPATGGGGAATTVAHAYVG